MVRDRSRISKSSELIPTSETIVSKIETPLSTVMEEGKNKREDNSLLRGCFQNPTSTAAKNYGDIYKQPKRTTVLTISKNVGEHTEVKLV